MYIHSESKEMTSLGTPLTSLNDLSGMNGTFLCVVCCVLCVCVCVSVSVLHTYVTLTTSSWLNMIALLEYFMNSRMYW